MPPSNTKTTNWMDWAKTMSEKQRTKGDQGAMSELADELVLERTSLYRSLTPLKKLGCIEIVEAESGHKKIASLTGYGIRLIDEAEPFWLKAQRNAVAAIGEENWQHLSQLLLGIPGLISQIERIPDR